MGEIASFGNGEARTERGDEMPERFIGDLSDAQVSRVDPEDREAGDVFLDLREDLFVDDVRLRENLFVHPRAALLGCCFAVFAADRLIR